MPSWMEDELEDRRRRSLYRHRRPVASPQGPCIRIKGREYLNFSSNDYLNLAADPRLARGASRLVSGHLPPLRALERTLAEWEGTEAALVFSSGFAANLALISSLTTHE